MSRIIMVTLTSGCHPRQVNQNMLRLLGLPAKHSLYHQPPPYQSAQLPCHWSASLSRVEKLMLAKFSLSTGQFSPLMGAVGVRLSPGETNGLHKEEGSEECKEDIYTTDGQWGMEEG